jgi:hypothetical protein
MLNLQLRRGYCLLGANMICSVLGAAQDPSQLAQEAAEAMRARNYPQADGKSHGRRRNLALSTLHFVSKTGRFGKGEASAG